MTNPGKLRSIADGAAEAGFPAVAGAIREAADEIERLRAELADARGDDGTPRPQA